ncbi:jg15866 [Pararge aegeria aegeria]|uniref:Jg15866 protein n=1 Tax=Pararge aegeria aegeria TaxID=348720 RepID=A0A8S4RC08_9NEOP|nr:jg15866 [Pararge aegeria aegeria]
MYRPPSSTLDRGVHSLLDSQCPTILAGYWNTKHPACTPAKLDTQLRCDGPAVAHALPLLKVISDGRDQLGSLQGPCEPTGFGGPGRRTRL